MNKKYGIVYKITNKINGKVYIGVTTRDFNKRYKGNLRSGTHNEHLRSAIDKYGINNFIIDEEIDCAFNAEELNDKERFYMSKYESMNPKKGYNKVTGGQWGYEYSKEAKLKIRHSNPQKKTVYQYELTGEYVKSYVSLTSTRDYGYSHKAINDCCLGKNKTAYGYYWSYDFLSKDEVVDIVSRDTRTNTKPVYQYTMDGVFVKRFNAIHDAKRELNVMPQNVYKVCVGQRKSCGGYKWSYTPLHLEVS